ncbi:hypothetical protein scyTo_0012499 [Scyliorhinus torazame]|uniref:Ig-like domain-containing protein n=1 Tax=Scyliorhinus torazame TaxID=75743 RepID=A0A401P9K6_SCYTO|nr:hypothetical protein [Scyliorhinus torazame]
MAPVVLALLSLVVGLAYTSEQISLIQPDSVSTRENRYPKLFTGLEDEKTNVGHLTIANVETEDAARMNSCFDKPPSAQLHSSDGFYTAPYHSGRYFGSGTRLNVLGRQPANPTVSLLPPAKEQIAVANQATQLCLVNNFYPESVQLVWSVDGNVRETGIQTSSTLLDSDQTYTHLNEASGPTSRMLASESNHCEFKPSATFECKFTAH